LKSPKEGKGCGIHIITDYTYDIDTPDHVKEFFAIPSSKMN